MAYAFIPASELKQKDCEIEAVLSYSVSQKLNTMKPEGSV